MKCKLQMIDDGQHAGGEKRMLFGIKRTKLSHYYFIYYVITPVATSHLAYTDYNIEQKTQL